MTDTAANWERVRHSVAEAAERVGRDARDVHIIAATKTKPVEVIEEAIAAGVTEIGENYVQEAAAKIVRIGAPVVWHLIGHLQRNKARRALELFNVIQTVDSVKLGEVLDRLGAERGQPVHVLIEVNLGGEATKTGVRPEGIGGLLVGLAERRWLSIDGLMTIPPPGPSPESARSFFRTLRELRDHLLQRGTAANAPLRELSMGMTDDFTVAVEEGATMVRIGRAIFGER